MSLVTVPIGGTSTISQGGSDSVAFVGVGTLNVTGTAQSPIVVSLSSVAGVGLLDTINMSYADVTLGGTAGISALVDYNIGAGATMRLQSLLGVSAGSLITFTAPKSHLVFSSGINLLQLSNISIAGFGPGSNIDLAGTGFSSYTYADASGTGTGGTLTLKGPTGNTLGSVTLTTGEFTASSFNVHSDGNGGTLIDFATYVSGIAATPSTADLTVGGTVVFKLATTAPVTIAGGTPTLTLNDGGTATYDAAHSTSSYLAFNYTVQSGQNTPDLTIASVNLNGATATDMLGSTVSLAGGVGNPAGTLQIDTTPPTITGIAATPNSGSLNAGHTVVISLTTSEAVTVAGGTPSLTLNDGGTTTFDAAHSTATNLVFNYTVQTGQNTADLTVIGSNLNGATITDAAGNVANLAGAVGNPAGILQIDTTPPTIASISTTPGSGTLTSGQVVAINLTPSEAVTISGGTPTLTLNDGRTATYDLAHSTATNLVFTYTVQPGDNTADLTITGTNLNGATIADLAGNTANLAGAIGNPPGVLQIDTTAPTIASISTTPGSGAFDAGQVVSINLTASKAVTVAGGTPTLTLNDGGTATYDAAHSTATNLVFKYTVQPGDNTGDLSVTGANLNGAAITDLAGNVANLAGAVGNPPGTLQIDTTAPTITSISTSPGGGSVGAGQMVAISLTASEAVTIAGGTPTLTLNDGGTATYDAAHSTATNLVFNYTVQAGQNTADLTVTGSSLNGATITDPAGNAANLAGAVGNPPGTLKIDTTAPTITGISTSPGSGSVGAGQVVAISLTASEAVTVAGGTPTLMLNDGGTATYDAAHSTATNLVFDYIVQAGQNTADLTVTGSNLNGATIVDPAGNAANLAGAFGNPAGTLQIDTTPPTIIGLSTTPGSGTLAAGQVVAINLAASEAVTVTGGIPSLTLSDGGTAIYDAVDSTPTNLVFKYIVQPGDMASDLAVSGTNLNGATIADAAGNAANLAGAIGNPPGTLQINTTLPAVTSVYGVTTTPGSGDLGVGSTVAVQITLTGTAVLAGGTPTLTLNDGGIATYSSSSSTSTSLVFLYTVQSGDNTADLAATALSLNGATLIDGTGNLVDLSPAVTNPGGILQIDTLAPTLGAVTATPGTGSVGAGQVVTITIPTSEAVTVSGGIPSLMLNDGGIATYDAADSTATSLVFKYTALSGQNTSGLTILGSTLNGATIADGAGNAATFVGAVGNLAGTLLVDTTPPTITSISATPGSGVLAAGQVVAIHLTPSEAVAIVGGVPTLTLNDGGIATFDAGASTATDLVFDYTVQAGQNTPGLAVTGSNLNGANIADLAGNAANLAGAVGNLPGTLQIVTASPTVTSVSTSAGSLSLGAGQMVAIDLTTSAAVTVVGGTPVLMLNDGGTATYDAAHSNGLNLVFDYTVQAGDNTSGLAVIGSALNGALIADGVGNIATLAGAIGTLPGPLKIDTTAPTITSISTTPGSGSLSAGQVVAINLTATKAVTIVGGTPTLMLNDTGIAIYDAAHSTATNLVFKYTVQPGDNISDLTVIGSALNGATVADGVGNIADLAGAVGNPPGTLKIDTTPPTIISISTTPGSGTLAAGQVVAINLNASELVIVAGGTPTLTLNDGGIATYDAVDSTPTNLVFKYIVQSGDSASDLAVTGFNLNGSTIADGAGNAANLVGAIGNPAGTLQIDTTLPAVASVYGITTTPGTGDLGVGSTVALQITLTGNATVVGGTPTLTLNNGGTATYDASSSTPTTLVFRYTVQPNQDTADLAVSGLSLNGSTVVDGSGNGIDLSPALINPGGILQIDTTAPTIGVATTPSSGLIGAGQVVIINIPTNQAVTVSGGTPSLTLNDGGTAIYDAARSTATNLVFDYVVQPGDATSHLTIAASSLNGAVIADGAGNAVNLSASVGNVLATLRIDTAPPTITSISTTPGSGSVETGQVVTIDIIPSAAITVANGTPTLTLDDGGTAVYDAAVSTPTHMVFKYTVQPGDSSEDLAVTAANLNGASITDSKGSALDLSTALGDLPGHLEVNTVSVVTAVTASPADADLTVGGTVAFQLSTSGPIIITGGTPTLSLNDGGTAVYDAANSTATNLVFRYTVQAGENTSDLSVTAASLNDAVITDGAGHLGNLDGAVGNPDGILKIDTTAPYLVNLVMSGSFDPGELYFITAYISEPVTIEGGPFSYQLSNGGVAVYDPLLSTPTSLVTTYVVQPGDDLSSLSIVGYNTNGAVATDAAGNVLVPPSLEAMAEAAVGNFADVTNVALTPTTIDIYRFFDTSTGTHFYTEDQTERATILATRPDLVPEGTNGVGLTAVNPAGNDPNAVPIYRFFDTTQGTQFLTANMAERDTIIATRPDLVYEPSSTFYEHATPQAGDTAVYRYFDLNTGTHFYTDSPTEQATILQTRPDLVLEGIGFYEPARNPVS